MYNRSEVLNVSRYSMWQFNRSKKKKLKIKTIQ